MTHIEDTGARPLAIRPYIGRTETGSFIKGPAGALIACLRKRRLRRQTRDDIDRLDAHLRKDAGLPPADYLLMEAEHPNRLHRYR